VPADSAVEGAAAGAEGEGGTPAVVFGTGIPRRRNGFAAGGDGKAGARASGAAVSTAGCAAGVTFVAPWFVATPVVAAGAGG